MLATNVSLDDKYTAEEGRIFHDRPAGAGRLPMTQMRRDRAAGLNTAAFIIRLSRLAARRLRPAACQGQKASSINPTSPSSRASTRIWPRPPSGARSRLACRPGVAQGRRARHLVWQGAGRRPLRRRPEAWQRRRYIEARRCALLGRRRSLRANPPPSRIRPTTTSCRR